MRVLCVATDHPPHRAGGYERQCAGTVAHLRAHGHEVRVLTSARAGGPRDTDPGVVRELERHPVTPSAAGTRDAVRVERVAAAALARQLREFVPDVISWWRLGELPMSLLAQARAAGVPGVGMVCDPWFRDGPARDPSGAPPDLAAARWLFVSRHLRDAVGGEGDVVPAGIDLAALAPADPPPWRGRLLYLGRLSPLKGIDTAIAALDALPEATLDVVGDGDPAYVEHLRSIAGGRVAFHPAVEDVARVYAAADAVLFPVRWDEPWGLVPLEAMAVGRPVVATGTGGSAEYLRDGVNALLFAREDGLGLAAAVERLADAPALRARLRAGGRATALAHPAEASHAAVRQALEAEARTAPARIATSRSA